MTRTLTLPLLWMLLLPKVPAQTAHTMLPVSEPVQYQISNGPDRLYTTLYPRDRAETVILLHGGPGFPSELKEVAEMLHAGFQVITFHQRGTGKSPCRSDDYSMEAYISDIDTVAEKFHIEKFHLWGHSWGGLYAQIYAEKRPEKLLSLFLCCPGSGTGAQWVQTEKEVLQLNKSKCSRGQWMAMGFNSLLGALGSDGAYRRLFRQVMLNYNDGFVRNPDAGIDFDNLKAVPINRTRREIVRYPLLQCQGHTLFPVTIVYGDQDIYQSSKNFVLERYPDAQVYVLPNSGHIPWLHNPAAYRAVLEKHYGTETR